MILDLYGLGSQLLAGTWMTLKSSLAVVCMELLLGLPSVIAKTSEYTTLRFLGDTYTATACGISEAFWVLVIYFDMVSGLNALGDFFGKSDLVFSPLAINILVPDLCFGACTAEVSRGASLFIPRGHREASQALNLSPGRIFWHIILSQIWRITLPGPGSLYPILLKGTALVSLIILDEIMRKTQAVSNVTKEPFILCMTAAVIYLSPTVVIMVAPHFPERCAGRGFVRDEL